MAAAPAMAPDIAESPIPEQPPAPMYSLNFKEVVDLFRDRREMILYQLRNNVHLVAFEIS